MRSFTHTTLVYPPSHPLALSGWMRIYDIKAQTLVILRTQLSVLFQYETFVPVSVAAAGTGTVNIIYFGCWIDARGEGATTSRRHRVWLGTKGVEGG